MFKISLRFFIFISLFIMTLQANDVTLVKTDSSKNFCNVCGMHLSKFYKTNHVSEFKNSHKEQYCSIRCQSAIHEEYEDKIKTIKVVDTNSLKFIDATKAFYVVGSSKKGTMSAVSKYAFLTKGDAEQFQKEFGGEIKDFNQTLKIAKKHLHSEQNSLDKKRSNIAKKGKKIYQTLCKSDKELEFNSIGEAKQYLIENNTCKKVNQKMLQAVSIYLTYPLLAVDQNKMMKVPSDEKCPVCGMFVAKYPKWVAKIQTQDNHEHFFDGVKDMMKFYFNPSKYKHNHKETDIKNLKVTDYYSLNEIDAKKSFYVIGSNVYGPMGEELIPFKTKEQAQEFSKSHFGKKVLSFDEITKDIL